MVAAKAIDWMELPTATATAYCHCLLLLTHPFGQLLQRFPLLYFLQHFFLRLLPCITGRAKGNVNLSGEDLHLLFWFKTLMILRKFSTNLYPIPHSICH